MSGRRGPFSWFFDRGRENPAFVLPARPSDRDMTSRLVANEKLLWGLYRGDWPGLEFASPLCFTPVNLLAQFVGYPTPRAQGDDPVTQIALDYIVKRCRPDRIHRGSFVAGNAWRWPRFDAEILDLAVEAIPDASIADILIDIQTERAHAILTDEQIKVTTGENKIATVERKRRFDRSTVDVKWLGERPQNVEDASTVNLAGILPVNFAFDAAEGQQRGSPVFARVLRSLKDYHDTAFRISQTLTKFKVKQVQTVENPEAWIKENGLSTAEAMAAFDISENTFIVNRINETTKYEFLPDGATAALEKALERIFWTIIEGTGIPEVFWGPMATGNHASVETSASQAVKYATSVRDSYDDPWFALISGALAVLSIARGETYKPFTMAWNRIDDVAPAVKSEILLRFAQTAQALVGSAACTKKQLYSLWTMLYPESDPGKYEEFIAGIAEMAVHKTSLGADYGSAIEDFTKGQGSKKPEDAE